MLLPTRILGTGGALPRQAWTTAEVVAKAHGDYSVERIVEKTGIQRRHWSGPDDTAAGLAARALREALEMAQMEAGALRRIIFVNSIAGDHFLPPTSCMVMKELGLSGSCDCFDLNNACMGFLSGLDLAARSVATGCGPVAVVVAECPSWYIKPEDPRPWFVFGDAAGAAILGEGRADEGVLGVALANDPFKGGSVMLPNPGRTGEATSIQFVAGNKKMGEVALGAMMGAMHEVLSQTGLTLGDMDWLVPHQPNGRMLDHMLNLLQISEERIVRVVDQIGSTGAASMATSLNRLMRERQVEPGQLILLAGVGTGISYGAMVVRV